MDIQPQEVILYTLPNGNSPFENWLLTLRDGQARAKIRKRLARTRLGNLGDFKPVGKGVLEFRIDYGPGYRIYFARLGDQLILLLCGGNKKTQSKDIVLAQQYWINYQEAKNADS